MNRFLFLLCCLLLAACAPSASPVTPHILNAYVTSAASPRLSELYECSPASIVIALTGPDAAQLTLRIGEPQPLLAPAYQVGTEDILVVNHPQAGVGALTLDQVQQLFSGRIENWKDVGGNDLPVQVWTFARDEDIQQIFDRSAMHGEPVTSLARLAVSAQDMSDSVGAKPGSIGYLPRRWKAGNVREALVVATVPVLAITKSDPDIPAQQLIACLQAKK